jgi:hypothetical protein
MNADIQFHISTAALNNLHREAIQRGMPVGRLFRNKAHALGTAEQPAFSLSGEESNRVFNCGVHPTVYARLLEVAERMSVPVSSLGELVAAFDLESA